MNIKQQIITDRQKTIFRLRELNAPECLIEPREQGLKHLIDDTTKIKGWAEYSNKEIKSIEHKKGKGGKEFKIYTTTDNLQIMEYPGRFGTFLKPFEPYN